MNQIHLRINNELQVMLAKRAQDNNRSVNAEIVNTLEESFKGIQIHGAIKDNKIEWYDTPQGIEQSR
jgi:hypothetical protein